jgi:hypothetical protein
VRQIQILLAVATLTIPNAWAEKNPKQWADGVLRDTWIHRVVGSYPRSDVNLYRNPSGAVASTIWDTTETDEKVFERVAVDFGGHRYIGSRRIEMRNKPLKAIGGTPIKAAVEGRKIFLLDERGRPQMFDTISREAIQK